MSRIAPVICFLAAALGATTALAEPTTLAEPTAPAELATPIISQVQVTNGDLSVAAAPVTGATSYEGQISFINQVNLSEIRKTVATMSTGMIFRASEIPTNTAVNVVVIAVDRNSRRSRASAPVSTFTGLAAPTGVAGTAGRLQISISWKPVNDATSYRLTLSNGMSFVTTSPSYIVTGLPTATSFNCLVWAIRANGETSAPSAVTVVKTANIALDLG